MKKEITIMRTTKEVLKKLKIIKLKIEFDTEKKLSYSEIIDNMINEYVKKNNIDLEKFA